MIVLFVFKSADVLPIRETDEIKYRTKGNDNTLRYRGNESTAITGNGIVVNRKLRLSRTCLKNL